MDERERRRCPRGEIYGRALWVSGETAIGYDVENLGIGGALLSGGPPLPNGEILRLVLRVDPLPAMAIEARLAWTSDRGYGVAFVGASAEMEEAILSLSSGHPEEPTLARPKLASWLP